MLTNVDVPVFPMPWPPTPQWFLNHNWNLENILENEPWKCHVLNRHYHDGYRPLPHERQPVVYDDTESLKVFTEPFILHGDGQVTYNRRQFDIRDLPSFTIPEGDVCTLVLSQRHSDCESSSTLSVVSPLTAEAAAAHQSSRPYDNSDAIFYMLLFRPTSGAIQAYSYNVYQRLYPERPVQLWRDWNYVGPEDKHSLWLASAEMEERPGFQWEPAEPPDHPLAFLPGGTVVLESDSGDIALPLGQPIDHDLNDEFCLCRFADSPLLVVGARKPWNGFQREPPTFHTAYRFHNGEWQQLISLKPDNNPLPDIIWCGREPYGERHTPPLLTLHDDGRIDVNDRRKIHQFHAAARIDLECRDAWVRRNVGPSSHLHVEYYPAGASEPTSERFLRFHDSRWEEAYRVYLPPWTCVLCQRELEHQQLRKDRERLWVGLISVLGGYLELLLMLAFAALVIVGLPLATYHLGKFLLSLL